MKKLIFATAGVALFSSAALAASDWPFASPAPGSPAGARPGAAMASQGSIPLQPVNNEGPVKLLSVSWLGGPADDDIVGAAIAPDGAILLALNGGPLNFPGAAPVLIAGSADVIATYGPRAASYIVRLTANGQRVLGLSQFSPGSVDVKKLKSDLAGNPYLLGVARGPIQIAGVSGSGEFVAALSPDATRAKSVIFRPGAIDFGVDGNGDIVILTKGHMARFKPGAATPAWDVSLPSHGDNRPGGMAVDPSNGVAAAVGYGMTRTGHEPYKDPWAYGFDRSGEKLWGFWNPDPTKEAGTQYGGNGLMADTTGVFCATDGQGKIYLGMRADGGNTVTSRDPTDPFKPIDSSVYSGVFQDNAGFGFRGASMSALILRADGESGRLEKGTYMTAWLTPQRANGLFIEGAAGGNGLQFVVGNSASGFRTKEPWYEAPAGGYKGGGFLAVFDPQFQMIQGGYFPGSTIHCVAARNGTVVIAGNDGASVSNSDRSIPGAPTINYPVPIYDAVQPAFAGGRTDGYFAVFKVAR